MRPHPRGEKTPHKSPPTEWSPDRKRIAAELAAAERASRRLQSDYESHQASPGRRGHSAPPLAAVGCHSLGIYEAILQSLLSLSVQMTVPPRAAPGGGRPSREQRRLEAGRAAGESDDDAFSITIQHPHSLLKITRADSKLAALQERARSTTSQVLPLSEYRTLSYYCMEGCIVGYESIYYKTEENCLGDLAGPSSV